MKGKKPETEQSRETELPVPFDESGMGTRINAICAKIGSKSKLAKMAGLSESQLYRIIAGESEPKLGAVVAIAKAGKVSIDSLVTGERFDEPQQDEFVYIPKMVPVEISAGHGSEPVTNVDMQYHAFRRDWLASRGLKSKSLAIVTAKGDSMEPTIPDGATLLVDTSVSEFTQDGVYVVRLDGHLFAKRLQRGQGGSILVISDNALYDKVSITPTSSEVFSIQGKVVWLGRNF